MTKKAEVKLIGMYRDHKRCVADVSGESLTKQSFKDECDINNIMRKYEQTGVLMHARQHMGQYGDFLGAPEYHEAMNAIVLADEMFMSLPSKVRAKFGNDPAAFLAFVQDEKNSEEMRELGLLSAVGLADEEQASESDKGPKKKQPKKSGTEAAVEAQGSTPDAQP